MFDSSAQLQQDPPRRRSAADDDTLYRMGYRDCAQEAVRFLTDGARLNPDSTVVQGIRDLLDSHTSSPRVLAGSGDVSSDGGRIRRVRRTTNIDERENRSMTSRRCPYGDVSRRLRHSGQARCRHSRTAAVTVTSPNLVNCVPATDRDAQPILPVGTETSRLMRYPLRTLQRVPASSSSTDDVPLLRDVDETTAADVVDCASELLNLAQLDSRVGDLLTELLQLMDAD